MPPTPGNGRRDERRMKAILAFVAAVAFVAAPFLVRGFAGFEPSLFPVPQDRPPVQPAGYAFSIWLPIYVGLLVHAGFGLFLRAEDAGWDAPRWPLVVSLGAGSAWLGVATFSPIWATVLIWVMLAGALLALWFAPRADRWPGQLPLGLYAGWLTAASWVSVGFLLGGYGLASETLAALVAVALAAVFALAVQLGIPRAPEYGLAVIWALVAVALANLTGSLVVAALALLAAAAMGLALWRVCLGR